MRYAAGVRTLLVVSVGLAVLSSIAVITQAVLLAGILADVIIGGADLPDVADRLVALSVVIAVRAGLAWASEEIAPRIDGPSRIPAAISPMTRGWPSRATTSPTRRAATTITAIATMTSAKTLT